MTYLTRITKGLWSLFVGLWVTIKHLGSTVFKRTKVTEQYPHEEPTLSPNFRSAIQLIRFDESNSHDCVGCKACSNPKRTPSGAIKMKGNLPVIPTEWGDFKVAVEKCPGKGFMVRDAGIGGLADEPGAEKETAGTA